MNQGRIRELSQTANSGVPTLSLAQMLKEQRKPEYYVPYNVDYVRDSKVDIFIGEKGVQQLVLKYKIPAQNGIAEKTENIVIATNSGRTNLVKSTELLTHFLKTAQKYVTLSEIKPEKYLAKLRYLGWETTGEGMDVLTMHRNDPDIILKKTKFTQTELEQRTQEDVEQNHKECYAYIEEAKIKSISEYIKNAYGRITPEMMQDIIKATDAVKVVQSKLPKDINQYIAENRDNEQAVRSLEELQKYVERVQQAYPNPEQLQKKQEVVKEYQEKDTQSDKNVLSQLFSRIEPIIVSNQNSVQETVYNKILQEYMKGLPEQVQIPSQRDEIMNYLEQRLSISMKRTQLLKKENPEQSIEETTEYRDLTLSLENFQEEREQGREKIKENVSKLADQITPEDIKREETAR